MAEYDYIEGTFYLGENIMAKAKIKPVVKSAAVEKTVEAALTSLTAVSESCVTAIALRSKDAKSNTAESKHLAKKRAILMKRKKGAASKVKKDPSAANKKAVKDIEKELATVVKLSAKLKPAKVSNAAELVALKTNQKKLAAYVKGIEQADKALNKPKKKKRKSKRRMAS